MTAAVGGGGRAAASGRGEEGDGRIRATYLLTCGPGEDPEERARDVAWEQTVELAPGSVSSEVEERSVGRVESLSTVGGDRWRAIVSHAPEVAGDDVAQLLNLLWGNVSLKAGVLLADLELPGSLLGAFGGPAHGISGIREACAVHGRPLLCGALKPLGAGPGELAERAGALARGGADLVKDDHSLVDQPWAPFAERVRRCAEAVADANAGSEGCTLYLPQVTASPGRVAERVEIALEAGCRGALLNAMPAGLPTLRSLADDGRLFLLAHPSLAGGFLGSDHGIDPGVLLGTLFRLAGADGVVYPNVGGRFPFDEETCRDLNERLRRPLGGLRPCFPVPGGGIDVERIPHWTRAYGEDTVFLVGGSLYAQPDLEDATRRLVDELERDG